MTLMRRFARRLLVGLWLAAAFVAWNAVFDAQVRAGARRYVDQQEEYVKGRGPRADMDAVMRGAAARGARFATLWTLLILAPGVAVMVARRARKGSGVRSPGAKA